MQKQKGLTTIKHIKRTKEIVSIFTNLKHRAKRVKLFDGKFNPH